MASALLEPFLERADRGLRGALAACLGAPEVRRLAWSGRRVRGTLADPVAGPCCPHLRPRSGAALAAALLACDAPQVRSLRPLGNFDSASFLPELAGRLGGFAWLEDLGPLCIDTAGGPLLVPRGAEAACPGADNGEEEPAGSELCFTTARCLLPALAEGFRRCRQLSTLDLTLHCVDVASASVMAETLLPALGGCCRLRVLCLDLDSSMPCGGTLVSGVARMLRGLSAWRRLERLSLGYLWWTEASEDALALMRDSLQAFGGSVLSLAVRYPQDQEMGALDAVCTAAVEGAAQGVEEVSIVEAWGQDGSGLPALVEALGACQRLRRASLLGVLPQGFNKAEFVESVRAAALEDISSPESARPPAVISFSTPGPGSLLRTEGMAPSTLEGGAHSAPNA
mmetsp:Transcript_80529/g.260966  ORF Transcript_80529/g.260966 Transcript_80529/m.260966 type:complete len:398 (-) Transcript_80529:79-1272(-)